MSDMQARGSLFYRATAGLIWAGIGTTGQTLVQFVVLVVLARILTPEDFGLVTAAMIVVGISGIFSLLGVGPAIIQRPSLEPRHIQTAFSISLLLGASFYLLVILIAPLVEPFFRMDGLVGVLRVAALIFPIKGLSVVAESLAQREFRFRFLSMVTVLSFSFGYALFGIVFAVLGYGPYALVAAYLAQALIQTVLLLSTRPHSLIPRLESKAFGELMYFGSGYTLDLLGNYIALQGDNLVVGRLLGASSLGYYGRAYQMMMMPVRLLGSVLDRVLFPTMATIQNSQMHLKSIYRKGMVAVALTMLPISVFVAIFAPELVDLVLGEQWSEVVVPLQILSAGLLFRTGYKVGDSLSRATGAIYRRAWRQWMYSAAVVGFSMIGSLGGLKGVAIGVTAAIIANYILVAELCRKLTGLSWNMFLVAHLPGLSLAATWLVSALLVKSMIPADASPIFVLSIAGLVLATVTGILWGSLPRLFLGNDGQWFVNKLRMTFRRLASPPR